MFAAIATPLTVVLIALLASRLFVQRGSAAVCAALFLTMPIAWTATQGGAPQIVLVPMLLAWLLSMEQYRRSGTIWLPGIAGAVLALMPYLHQAGMVMAPIYLAITVLALAVHRARMTAIPAVLAGFAIVVTPWLVSWMRDPSTFAAAVTSYGLYDAGRFNVLQGLREITSWVGLTVRAEVYWEFLNPAMLFLSPEPGLAALWSAPVFFLPFAIPLARGLAAYARGPRDVMAWLLLGAFLAAPAAAALIARPPVAARLILLAPIAALIATRGCYPGAFSTMDERSPATPAISASTV
jgi:hypothetical protein